jgi:TonB-linked SusC/RagA family outer membrane protein
MIRNITTAARSCRKLLLITALTAFLFFNQLLHAGAYLYSQTVTLSVHDMPLEKVCREIEKQTGYYFVYAKDQDEKKHLISLQVKNELISTVLQKVFSGLPYSYSVIDKVVVINTVKHTAPAVPPVTTGTTIDTISLQGRVVNRQGEALVNASVTTTKTKKATITDLKGTFKLKGLNAGDMLLVSYAGYKTQLVSPQKQALFVVLDITDNELDKVVVQAYGTTSRRLTTSNIGVVTAKDIEQQRTMNPLLALQGRVAGLEITPASGYELGPVKVEIRGRNVVNPSFTSDPLYIIDGVPLTIMDVGGTNSNPISGNSISYGMDQSKTLFTGGLSPLFNVNTADIESIEVLKDADATAIYGSRGANGVILINTKKGKPGKNQLGVGFSQGVNFITRKWEMLNTSQYLAMRREAFKNDGITPTAAPGAGYAPDLFLADTTRDTDWQEYYWGRMGQWTDGQANYSGGTGQVNFRIGARYNKSKDITTLGSTSKTSFSVSLNTHSFDNRFYLSFGANYNYTGANLINVSGIATVPPDAPPVYDDQGNLNYIGWKTLGLTFPFAGLLQPYSTKVNFLNTNLDLKYNILSGLTAHVSLGYNSSDNTSNAYRPLAAQDPTTTGRIASASLGINKANNWVLEPQLEYNVSTGVGRWNVLVGGTVQNNATKSMSVGGQGYTNDALLYSISNAVTVTSTERYGKYKYAGAFGRITYNYDNKYILNLNGRRDGSSRFGAGKQFGNFGSVGAAWLLSEETWIRKNVPAIISFIKLRGSYGLTGGDAVGDYQYLSQWGNLSPVLTAYNGVAPLTPQIQSNNDFHWQSNKKAEAGLDLGFVNDRFGLMVVYYNNRCNNQLISFPTPVFTGFGSVTANSPANVQNSGWEFQLNASVIHKKEFEWSATFNISFNKNKLLSYPLFEQSPFYSKYKIGESLNNRYVLNFLGVDPQTGSYVVEDHNHDGKIMADTRVQPGTHDDDYYVAINLSPVYMGGMGHNFRYKNWQLSTYFSYKKGMGLNSLRGITSSTTNTSLWEYNHRWKNPGDISEAPKLTTVSTATSLSSSNVGWADASFIRLQTVGLSYSLPDKIAHKARLNNLAVSINAQNLFVITKYKGGDPEGSNFGAMPPTRTITAGLTCSL